MTRVATFGNYQSALLDLMRAQTRGAEAQERVSTQKVATDLTGFGRQSETLTALKGAESRLNGFMETAKAVEARLTTQDLALTQIGQGLDSISAAIGSVLATDSAGSLMLELEGQFPTGRGGLTIRHPGAYILARASTTTSPMGGDNPRKLAAAPTVASIFRNDGLKTASRVAEGTTLETGMLANEVGAEIMEILRDIQIYHASANGPLTGKVTQAQKDFLTTQLARLEQANTGVIDKTATTGSLHNQVEAIGKSHLGQMNALDELVGDRTDADMAEDPPNPEPSPMALQASAQVISQLRQASLLNYLS